MARSRERDYDEDYEADDYEPRRPRSSSGQGPLDSMFANTNIIILVLFGCCCNGIAFILSLICFLTAKDPKAKSNAMVTLIISGIITVLAIIGNIIRFAGMAGGVGR